MKRTAFDGLVLLLPLTALAGIVAALTLTNPTAVVRAMLPTGVASTADPIVVAAQKGRLYRHIHLTSAGQAGGFLTGGQPLRPGDRFTITAPSGVTQVYAVQTIREIEVPLTTASDSGVSETSRLQLVTCENVDAPHAAPLRFIIESGRSGTAPIGLSHPQPL
jgi:hypothetical protein